jgi:hypothetical protein
MKNLKLFGILSLGLSLMMSNLALAGPVLLEFFLKKRVQKFYGGTSQPAIRSLGKVMKRKVQRVIYVKMGPR